MAAVREFVAKLEEHSEENNLQWHRKRIIPSTIEQARDVFFAYQRKLDREINFVKPATFRDDIRRCEWKFKQGAKPSKNNPLMRVFDVRI